MAKWHALGADPHFIRIWGDHAIAFNRLSGRTHVLNALAAEALLIIVEQPHSSEELVGTLTADLELEVTPSLSDAVRSYLSELEALGLIAQA